MSITPPLWLILYMASPLLLMALGILLTPIEWHYRPEIYRDDRP